MCVCMSPLSSSHLLPPIPTGVCPSLLLAHGGNLPPSTSIPWWLPSLSLACACRFVLIGSQKCALLPHTMHFSSLSRSVRHSVLSLCSWGQRLKCSAHFPAVPIVTPQILTSFLRCSLTAALSASFQSSIPYACSTLRASSKMH